MKFNPAENIQDLQYFGEFGGVNPSISDSSTYTFLSAKTMFDTFGIKINRNSGGSLQKYRNSLVDSEVKTHQRDTSVYETRGQAFQ